MIETRKARSMDSPIMARMAQTMASESDYAGDGINASRVATQIHRACCGDTNTSIILATDNGQIIGAVMYSVTAPWFADYPILTDQAVYVLPEYRGRGAGQALLQALIDEGHECGARRILIGVTADINKDATDRFLLAAGFETVGKNYRMRI